MKTFAEWLKERDMSMDNPLMPLVREAWFAGAASYAPPEALEPFGWLVAVEEGGRMRVYGPHYTTKKAAEEDAELPRKRGQKAEVWECFVVSPREKFQGGAKSVEEEAHYLETKWRKP